VRSSIRPSAPALPLLAAALLAVTACREGSTVGGSGSASLPPAADGAHGCNGAAQTFTPPQVPTAVDLTGLTLALGPRSHVAAAQGSETLYVTGAGATISALDVSAGTPPPETVLVSAGVVDALLATMGTFPPADLSGVAVLDATYLVVVEHASHTILLVDTTTPDTVMFFAGLPIASPGYADGVDLAARFAFTSPAQLCPTADGRVLVADPGNHAIRVVEDGFVATIAGLGTPVHSDGLLAAAGFDTPVGVAASCNNDLLVTELGLVGLGGHRLRALDIGDPSIFGGFDGTARTLAGDGTAATTGGVDTAASLAAPVGPASTADGDVYWLDSATGILRRYVFGTGVSDCPLFADCATAAGGPANFTPGGTFSLALTDADVLYVLDAAAGQLRRVTP
jgi:hypothetical protein